MDDLVGRFAGLQVQQPLAYRRLLAIRARIWRIVQRLDAEILVSAEPTPFGAWDPAGFRPIAPGTAWGGVHDCGWLRITGPASPDPRAEVRLGIRGESLVHDATGAVLDATTTVWLQGDLPHPGGRYRTVAHVDVARPIELYADATHNGVLIYPVGRAVFHGAELAVRDPEAEALYLDTMTLVVLAGCTRDRALRRELREALDASWRRFRGGDLDAARAALAPSLAAPSTSALEYTAVGHGHLDMAWLWPLRETRRKSARTYARALDTADRRPDVVYGTSQPQQMRWLRDAHPDLFARLRTAVAEGRIEAQGSFWVEPDTNLPNGESLIRQAIVGRRFLRAELGLGDDDLRLCWLPDTFGYSGALPQILRGTGMDWLQTIKLSWNAVNRFPHGTFRWRGIDGSEVLVHMPPEGDYNSRAAPDGLLRGERDRPERELDAALLVYGGGDGGGGPSELHHELLDRETGDGIRGLPRVRRGSASGFFRHLETLDVRAVHEGELYLELHQGTATTQAAQKRWNRTVERLLHEVEALAVALGPEERVATRDALEDTWQEVLLQQFHDILPGSSIARVHRESVATLRRIADELEERIARLVARLPAPGAPVTLEAPAVLGAPTAPGAHGTSEAPEPPAALNLAPVPRDEPVRVDGTWMRARVAPYATAALVEEPRHPELRADGAGLANGLLTLRFDDASGEIASMRDADGVEHAGEGLGRLVLHRDPFQWPWDAWDISPRALRARPRTLRLASSTSIVDGPRAIRRQVLEGPRVRVERDVVLEAGSPLVRLEARVDWRQSHRMLRMEHRPTRYADEAICEIQMGHIRRPTTERDRRERAQFEVSAHRWVAVEDERGGFASLNDATHGHRIKHGLVSTSMLRATTFPDRTADRGVHRFVHAVRAYAPGRLDEAIADGYRLWAPLRVVEGRELAPLATTDDPGVVVETVAPAYESDGTVVRLYESLGRATTTAIRTSIPHATALRTDMLERGDDPADLDRVTLRPFEIATIVLR